MLKSIINKFIKAVIDEVFLDAPSIQLSLGADLFSDSKIHLNNLTFRPDLFDISLQPLSLSSGFLGSLNVEGIAELALGGKLKVQAEDIFLLFRLELNPDAEKVQTMKKILIELNSSKFGSNMLSEIIRKLYGYEDLPEIDIKKKRGVLYKAFDYFSQSIFFIIKNVHVRFEFKNEDDSYSTIGLSFPSFTFSPHLRSTNKHPSMQLSLKSFLIYLDYNRESYMKSTFLQTIEFFKLQSKNDKHISLFGPFDLDANLSFDIKRKSGLVCPILSLTIPIFRGNLDIKQLSSINDILSNYSLALKKHQQVLKMQKIFRNSFPLPRLYELGGVRLLPHLLLRNLPYPYQCKTIPRGNGTGIVSFMKDRVGARWTVMLWKHLIRLVINDIRVTRPWGRWFYIAKLSHVRKEYAFLYAKLLKRVNDNGTFIFNPQAYLSAVNMRQLFEYEMMLSTDAVMMFRSLGYLIAITSYFASKASVNSTSVLSWPEILIIFSYLFEAQRETAFHRFDKGQYDHEDENLTTTDDNFSVKGSEDGSISYQNNSKPLSNENLLKTLSARNAISSSNVNPKKPQTSQSKFQSVTQKIFTGLSFSSSSSPGLNDEYDQKVMKKFDLSVFSDFFSTLIESNSDSISVHDTSLDHENIFFNASMSRSRKFLNTSEIISAVDWSLNRNQAPITFLPPEMSIKIDKITFEAKTSISKVSSERQCIFQLNINGLLGNLNISQSSSNNLENSKFSEIPTKRGFASLSGALIQVKFILKQLSCSLAVPINNDNILLSPVTRETLLTRNSNITQSEINSPQKDDNGNGENPSQSESERNTENDDDIDYSISEASDCFPTSATNNGLDLRSIPGVDPKIKYVPGHTIVSSMQLQALQEEKIKNQNLILEMSSQRNDKSTQKSNSGYTIETPIDDLTVIKNQKFETKRLELREFLSSAPADNLFVFCLILDLDDKGEGAGDMQFQFGGMRVDLSKRILAKMLDPDFLESFKIASNIYHSINQTLPILNEQSIIIDWETKIPLVIVNRDPPVFILNKIDESPTKKSNILQHSSSSHSQSLKSSQSVLIDDIFTDHFCSSLNTSSPTTTPHQNNRNATKISPEVDISQAQSQIILEMRKKQRAAIAFNKNMMLWLGFFEAYLPKVISLCIKTSPIVIQSLEATVIKDLVFAKVHNILDQAAKRHKDVSPDGFPMDHVLGLLSHLIVSSAKGTQPSYDKLSSLRYLDSKGIRKWGKKNLNRNETGISDNDSNSFKIKILLPALEIILTKLINPFPAIDLHVQQMTILKIPMSDETFCHYLAWLFAELMPMYY